MHPHISGALCLLLACTAMSCASYPPLEVVPRVEIDRYIGKWFEIASLPVSQQEGCSCTTAEYTVIEEGVLKIVNTCRKEGGLDQAEGKAFVVPNSDNAKLKVQFFWPFRGDYWILELDDEYRWAVVGVPSRKYVWVLSRSPRMAEETLTLLLERIAAKGFDVAKIQRTVHDCAEPG